MDLLTYKQKNLKYLSHICAVGILSSSFVGCGGGSSSGSTTTNTGYFLDSAVAGLNYKTATQSGVTDANGVFKYADGETITFTLGEVTIGNILASEIPSTGKILPQTVVGVPSSSTTDSRVVKIAQLLQSLDSDGDPTNGISITEAVKARLTTSVNLETDTNADISALASKAGVNLVSALTATAHLQTTTNKLTPVSITTSTNNTNNSGDDTPPGAPVAVEFTYTTTGMLIDGYISGARVEIDANNDGNISDDEYVVTDENGKYTITIKSFNTTSPMGGKTIVATGGTDKGTGLPFEGKLKAVAPTQAAGASIPDAVHVSPITTYVTALVEKGVSEDKAIKAVAKNLGIEEADIKTDPMKKPKVFFAAQKLQKIAEVFAATQVADSGFDDAFENVFNAMAETIKVDANNSTLSNIATDINASDIGEKLKAEVNKTIANFTIPNEIKVSAANLVKLVNDFDEQNITSTDVDVLGNFGQIINAQTEKIQNVVETAAYDGNLDSFDQNMTIDINVTNVTQQVIVADGAYIDPTAKVVEKVTKAIEAIKSVYLDDNNSGSDGEYQLIQDDLNNSIVGQNDFNLSGYDFSADDLNITWDINSSILSLDGNITRTYAHRYTTLTAEINASYTIDVNNSAFLSKTQAFKLKILRNEAAPVAYNIDVNMSEDNNYTVEMNATDANTDGNITYSLENNSSINGVVSLETNGTAFKYIPTKDFNGTSWFTYRATDDTGRTSDANVTFTVNNVNDPAHFENLRLFVANEWGIFIEGNSTITKNEDNGSFSVIYDIVDPDTAIADINFTVSSSNTALATVAITDADKNETKITLLPNANGESNITLHIEDNGGVSEWSFRLNVLPTPDDPVVEDVVDQNISEDATSFDINVTANDADGDNITYKLIDSSGNYVDTFYSNFAQLDINSTTGVLSIDTNENYNGNGNTVKIVAITADVNKTMTFNLNIANVNDAPTISTVSDINITIGDDYYLHVDANDTDTPYGDVIIFDINDSNFSINVNAYGVYLVTQTGELNGTASNELNTTTLTLTARDNNGSEANTTFSITINPYVESALTLPSSIDAVDAE